jgi:hypothetical protein
MTVSVILPAARDKAATQTIVDRLHENSCVTDIVVASPHFSVERATVFRDNSVGSSRALAQAIKFTDPNTTHIAWLSEICFPEPGAIDKMYEAEYYATDQAPRIWEFRTSPSVTLGHYRVCTILGRQYARWGFVSRGTLEVIGGFFDSVFVAHYGDVDLSLRCWKGGGSVATCVGAIIELRGHWHVNTAPASTDEATFIARWSPDYPNIRTDNTAEWNVDQEILL